MSGRKGKSGFMANPITSRLRTGEEEEEEEGGEMTPLTFIPGHSKPAWNGVDEEAAEAVVSLGGAGGTGGNEADAAGVALGGVRGPSSDTRSILRGTTRGWRAGTPLELYGTEEKVHELGFSRRLSTGELVDYVLVYRFPESEKDAENIAQRLRETPHLDTASGQLGRAFKRREFLLQLLGTVIFEEEVAEDNRTVFCKLHVPFDVLKDQAQDVKLKLPLKASCAPVTIENNLLEQFKSTFLSLPNFLKSWRVPDIPEVEEYYAGIFRVDVQERFQNHDDPERLFNEGQRGLLANNLLSHVRYGEKSHQIGILRLITNKSFVDGIILHDGPAFSKDETEIEHTETSGHRAILYDNWGRFGAWYMEQPLDYVRGYFGEKVGLYFAWLGFYTQWLWVPSGIGILAMFYGIGGFNKQADAQDLCASNFTMCPLCDSGCSSWALNSTCTSYEASYIFDNEATVIFAFVMAIWSSIFLDFWKRRNVAIAYDWDVLDFEQEEPNRPEFQSDHVRTNPVTGLEEAYYPKYRRWLKYIGSFASIFFMLLLVIMVLVAIILYRLALRVILFKSGDSDEDAARKNASTITALTAAIINLVMIIALNKLYGALALWLTNWENHRKQSSYESHLAFKIFLFQFVNSYSSLFYIAFFKGQNTGRPGDYNTFFGFRQDECPPYGCLLELTIQLCVIMIGKQSLNNVQEVVLPWLAAYMNRRKTDLDKGIVMPWERQLLQLAPYPRLGLFYEYLEMIIQFGFISLFVPAFPLAPLFALLNNILEIRVDASKHIQQLRRPPAFRAEDIGIWEQIMYFISYFAVLTNGLVIAFTSSYITKQVYRGNNGGSLAGYLDEVYPLSPVMNGTDPSIENCHYASLREADGSRGSFHYEVLAAKLGFLIVFEHVIFLLKVIIAFVIPDVPKSVKTAIQREKFLAQKALEEKTTGHTSVTNRMESRKGAPQLRDSFAIKFGGDGGAGAAAAGSDFRNRSGTAPSRYAAQQQPGEAP